MLSTKMKIGRIQVQTIIRFFMTFSIFLSQSFDVKFVWLDPGFYSKPPNRTRFPDDKFTFSDWNNSFFFVFYTISQRVSLSDCLFVISYVKYFKLLKLLKISSFYFIFFLLYRMRNSTPPIKQIPI